MTNNKIDDYIDFPIDNLMLYDQINNINLKYNLITVINHSGKLGYGHYISYVRQMNNNNVLNFNNDNWLCFDDNTVYSMNNSKVSSSTGYVLFYQLQ